jgi:DNA-binding CsgD family transcriptional regulator/tetratricopeptide (TPR) repeat protein
VVHQLGMSGRIRLVLTIRSGQSRSAPIERLAGAASTKRFDLGSLDRDEAHELIGELVGGRVEASAIVRLLEYSEGNPLYLRELVRGSVESGIFSQTGAVWRLIDTLRPTPRLRELLMSRVTPLGRPAFEALELLAVAGRIDLDLAGQLVGEGALEELERADLIAARREPVGMSVDIAQSAVRELLAESIGPLRRMRIYRDLAQRSPSTTSTEAAEIQHAVWHVRGQLPNDAARLIRAARIATRANDTPLGIELARAASRLTTDVEPVLIGCWCLSQLGRHEEAIADAEAALARVDDPWSRAMLHHRLAEEHWWFTHDLECAQWHLGGGTGLADGPWNDLLSAQRGAFAVLNGEVMSAQGLCRPLLDHDTVGVRFVASLGMSLALAHSNDAPAAAELSARAFNESSAASERDRLSSEPGIHMISQMIAMIYGGRCAEAAETAEFVHQVAVSLPGSQPRGWAATVRGFALLFGGEPAEAQRWFIDAEAHWIDAGLPGLARWVTAGLVIAECSTGDAPAATRSFARLETYESVGFALYAPIEQLARTWLGVLEGSTREALAAADQAIRLSTASGASALLAFIAHDLARLDLRLACRAARDALVDIVPAESQLGAMFEARLAFVGGVLDGDAAALVLAAERWEAQGCNLFAGESLVLAAGLHRRRGRSREQAVCDGRASVTLSRCGRAVTPPLAQRTSVGPLSKRELEIAEMAGSGMSSREIAGRLIIGERTVESHLYRVFLKLGVSSRDQIPASLARFRRPKK